MTAIIRCSKQSLLRLTQFSHKNVVYSVNSAEIEIFQPSAAMGEEILKALGAKLEAELHPQVLHAAVSAFRLAQSDQEEVG